MRNILLGLLLLGSFTNAGADEQPLQYKTKDEISQVVEAKIQHIAKLNDLDKKIQELTALKFFIETQQDNLNDYSSAIKDHLDEISEDLGADADNISGVNKVNTNITIEDQNKNRELLDATIPLLMQWGTYQSSLRPLFNFYVDHKSEIKNDPYQTNNCESVERELSEKSNSEKENQIYDELKKIAHSMCQP